MGAGAMASEAERLAEIALELRAIRDGSSAEGWALYDAICGAMDAVLDAADAAEKGAGA
jgi:hypothetical protein